MGPEEGGQLPRPTLDKSLKSTQMPCKNSMQISKPSPVILRPSAPPPRVP